MKKIFILSVVCLLCNVSMGFSQSKNLKKKTVKKEVIQTVKEVAKTEIKDDANAALVWHTNILKADSISKKTNKPIFGFFTGSDWCGWCHRLQANVFAKQEFIKWAKEKVVLLELDYPRNKKLPEELQQQNAQLQQAFQVQGFPTIWMFYVVKDSVANKLNLSPLGSLGYPSGGISGKEQLTFLETANQILDKAKK